MKVFILILLFLSLPCAVLAYPVSDDTYMSIKEYNRHLNDVIETMTNKFNAERNPEIRYELLVMRDSLVICREIVDGLNNIIGLIKSYKETNTLSIERMIMYCENRTLLLNGYLEMYQGSNNIKRQSDMAVVVHEITLTRNSLQKIIAELKVTSSN